MKDFIEILGGTILIVDDSPVNIRILESILEKSGYDTIIAMDGPECLEKSKKSCPDLVLLDIKMPGMSGIDVCKILSQDKETKDIPIIFITASMDDGLLLDAFESGGIDYVRKPINRVELLARIKSVLTQKRLAERLFKEEKLRGVLEIAGAVCHELNQPLQVISGISELLLMENFEDNRQHSDIRKIRDQVFRMAEITKKLMGITRYSAKDYVGKTMIFDIDKASNLSAC